MELVNEDPKGNTYYERGIVEYKKPQGEIDIKKALDIQERVFGYAQSQTDGYPGEVAMFILLGKEDDEYVSAKFGQRMSFIERYGELTRIANGRK